MGIVLSDFDYLQEIQARIGNILRVKDLEPKLADLLKVMELKYKIRDESQKEKLFWDLVEELVNGEMEKQEDRNSESRYIGTQNDREVSDRE
jgi:hypothetical protein